MAVTVVVVAAAASTVASIFILHLSFFVSCIVSIIRHVDSAAF